MLSSMLVQLRYGKNNQRTSSADSTEHIVRTCCLKDRVIANSPLSTKPTSRLPTKALPLQNPPPPSPPPRVTFAAVIACSPPELQQRSPRLQHRLGRPSSYCNDAITAPPPLPEGLALRVRADPRPQQQGFLPATREP